MKDMCVPKEEMTATCLDCEWEGTPNDCDFDYEYDEFYGKEHKYLICPICSGGIECN